MNYMFRDGVYIQHIKQLLIDFYTLIYCLPPSQEYSITHVFGSIVWYYRDAIELKSYFLIFFIISIKNIQERALD